MGFVRLFRRLDYLLSQPRNPVKTIICITFVRAFDIKKTILYISLINNKLVMLIMLHLLNPRGWLIFPRPASLFII